MTHFGINLINNLKKVLFITLLLGATAYSQSYRYDLLTGRVVLSLEGGMTYGKTDYINSRIGPLLNGRVEYFFPTMSEHIFGVRIYGGGLKVKGEDARRDPPSFSTDLYDLGLGGVYNYSLSDKLFLSLFAGLSENWFNPKGPDGRRAPHNAAGLYKKNALSFDTEFGVRVPINYDLGIMVSTGLHFMQTDNLDDVSPANATGFPAGSKNDYYGTVSISISYSLFGIRDSDGDGVPDYLDKCPNTPKGVVIDEEGCPLDSDHDGVPDFRDKCPGTPKGAKVDKYGCAIDSDHDGVPDSFDKCPNTPFGVKVDKNGCPLDADSDGVPNYLDKCPGTPIGVQVDSVGCPLDSDHDGVPDYLDKCPNTAPGVRVDSHGCPIIIKKEVPEEENKTEKKSEEVKKEPPPVFPSQPKVSKEKPKSEKTTYSSNTSKIVLESDEIFSGNTSKIDPGAYGKLNDIVGFLGKNIFTKWKVNGYVDSHTPASKQLTLSYERANAVMQYFINHGLPSFQFQINGLGASNPIASNDTQEGRDKNNRIEIVKLK